ncbi:hypothetical protein Tco_0676704 [Tanacetum coccineum]
MCRRQGYMIWDMERKCVTTDEFWKVHGKVDQLLHEIVPQLAERATNDLIEGNLKKVVADTVIQERDTFQAENTVIQVHPTITTSTETTSSADLQQQLYLKMKSNLQDQANDLALWDVLKRNFEKYSTSNTFRRNDEFYSQRHDNHQEDDAPPEGEKRVKRHKTSKSSKNGMHGKRKQVIDEDEVIPEDETLELIIEFQNVDYHVPTIFDHERIEATLNDMLNSLGKQTRGHKTNNTKASRFYGPQRNPNELPRYLYNKDLFFLKNGNTEEKKYILLLHKIHAKLFPEADMEEKMNRWVRKEFKNFNEDA